jgi:hypothetical protein
MKKLIVCIILVAYTCVVFAHSSAVVADTTWQKIGEVKANFKAESESILIATNEKFKSIKLKVADAPIDLDKVVIYYEDDKMQEIAAKGPIEAGNETKSCVLEYPTTKIKKVTFTYKSQPNYRGTSPRIELYGFK